MSKRLLNVRLETGESLHPDGSIKTDTNLFHIDISDDGFIESITPETETVEVEDGLDMNGQLALPPFKEMHNHLDKTYLRTGWKACRPVSGLKERLELERQELDALSDTVETRAEAMIERHLKYGVNHIRTHVNIDPYIKLKNLEGVKKALDSYQDVLTYEIVAFPQHGLLEHEEMPELLRAALNSGADILGALDPAGIDGDIDTSLKMTMSIAKEFQVDVDMHLHDRGHVGYYTMDKWLDMVEGENYQGKTAFSHAFGLSHLNPTLTKKFADRLNRHNVEIMSTIPISINHRVIPIDTLIDSGVDVSLGCDGYYDSWSPYVSGDILEKLNHFCNYTGKTTERALRNSLALVTGGVTPLNIDGRQQWPKVGDTASFVFTDASCSAEVVARLPKKRQLMSKGKFFK